MSNQTKGVEFFPTPQDLANLLVDRIFWKKCANYDAQGNMRSEDNDNTLQILEPSAGEGPFARAFVKYGHVTAIDPNFDDPEIEGVEWAKMSLEDLHEALEGERPFDVIGGNPPFSLAEAHLRLCFKMLRKLGVVAFLLRLGFLSSQGRAKFFAAYPPKHVFVLASRPSFMWSYTCKVVEGNDMFSASGCGHKWFLPPGVACKTCPACKNESVQCVKTDQYDYCFIVWQPDMPAGTPTTLSFINTTGEEVDV